MKGSEKPAAKAYTTNELVRAVLLAASDPGSDRIGD